MTKREKITENYPYQKFMDTFFILNEFGSPTEAYDYLLFLCSGDAGIDLIAPEGGTITPDYCKRKYKQYVDWWNNNFGEKDPQYIKSNDKLKSILVWLNEKAYLNVYKLNKTKRDIYLFGNYSKETLDKKLNTFKKLIGKTNEVKEEPKEEITVPVIKNVVIDINDKINDDDDSPF